MLGTQQQQQQQTRLIVGNPGGIITSQQQSQSHVLQTLTSVTTTTASTTISMSAVPTSNSNNMIKKSIQTIPATNLSLQQQRSLLQSLKQQQKQKQQQNQTQQLNKTTTINTNQIQLSNKQQISTRTIPIISTSGTTTAPTRVITSTSGQIISLEDLLQKQRNKQSSTTIPQIVTLTGCGSAGGGPGGGGGSSTQQQTSAPQFGIVMSPTTRGIISINPTTSTSTTTTTTGNNTNKTVLLSTASPAMTSPSLSTKKSMVSTATTPTIKTILSGGRLLMTAPNTTNMSGNIRIINTSNASSGATLNTLSFANLQGKQMLFSSKPNQSQLQNSSVVIGGQTVKLQGGVTAGNQLQTVIVGNQILRVQQIGNNSQNIKTSSGTLNRVAFPLGKTQAANTSQLNINMPLENSNNESNVGSNQTFILGGNGKATQFQKINTVKGLINSNNQEQNSPTSSVANPNAMIQAGNRVVLAVQSPFILPAGSFQGGTINLKSLQNMKLVSLAPTSASAEKEPQVPQAQSPL